MPNNPTIKGDNTVIWGTGGNYAGGIITSCSKDNTTEKLEVLDNNGYTVAVIYFNQKGECEFEMIVQTSAPTLAHGDQITICGAVNALVENTKQVWAQRDVCKFQVKATKYTGMTLT